jgi:hypothetical protein
MATSTAKLAAASDTGMVCKSRLPGMTCNSIVSCPVCWNGFSLCEAITTTLGAYSTFV